MCRVCNGLEVGVVSQMWSCIPRETVVVVTQSLSLPSDSGACGPPGAAIRAPSLGNIKEPESTRNQKANFCNHQPALLWAAVAFLTYFISPQSLCHDDFVSIAMIVEQITPGQCRTLLETPSSYRRLSQLPLIKTLKLFVRADVIAVICTVICGFGVVY